MRRPRSGSRRGFSLIEVAIALTILGMIAANVLMVTRSSSKAYKAGTSMSSLDMQLDRTMDRIALALMAARRESLDPQQPSPLWASHVVFDQSKGFEEGVEIIGEVERIQYEPKARRIVWRQSPGTADERQVVWTNWVRELFQGESMDGFDENANGLIDEDGLSFTVDGDRVTIRLTLEREGPDNTILRRTKETTVTCRN